MLTSALLRKLSEDIGCGCAGGANFLAAIRNREAREYLTRYIDTHDLFDWYSQRNHARVVIAAGIWGAAKLAEADEAAS